MLMQACMHMLLVEIIAIFIQRSLTTSRTHAFALPQVSCVQEMFVMAVCVFFIIRMFRYVLGMITCVRFYSVCIVK
jgi:hypothetical protein